MKKIIFLLLLTILSISAFCQIVINVEPGISVSRQNFIFRNNTIGISAFAGVEYLDMEITKEIEMNLSSNIGYIKKGGKFKNPEGSEMFSNLTFQEASMNLNYFSINTTADFKYPVNKVVIPFIGIGPYVDILVSNNEIDQFFNLEKPGTIGIGALVNLGLKYIYDDFQFGLKFNYYIGANSTASWLGRDIRPNSFGIGVIAGYRLK